MGRGANRDRVRTEGGKKGEREERGRETKKRTHAVGNYSPVFISAQQSPSPAALDCGVRSKGAPGCPTGCRREGSRLRAVQAHTLRTCSFKPLFANPQTTYLLSTLDGNESVSASVVVLLSPVPPAARSEPCWSGQTVLLRAAVRRVGRERSRPCAQRSFFPQELRVKGGKEPRGPPPPRENVSRPQLKESTFRLSESSGH